MRKKTCIIEWDKDRQAYWVRFMSGDVQISVEDYKSIARAAKSITEWTRS